MSRTHEWSALGTYAQLVVPDDVDQTAAVTVARRLVDAIDATCSRFRTDSDLSRANAAAGSWVAVDPLLVRAVDVAMAAARSSDGLVDPTLGRTLIELGYDRDLDLVRSASDAEPDDEGSPGSSSVAQPRASDRPWQEVETDPAGWLRVPAGCALDLGATGKAFAADLVAESVNLAIGGSVVVSLGGDVSAISQDGRAIWPVLVSDTAGPAMDVGGEVIMLGTGGLATSSTRHRRWRHHGEMIHHLVDPRTGRPADSSVTSATVRAGSCVEANVASTAAVILGSAAVAWLESRGLAAVVVDVDGQTTRCGTWPNGMGDQPVAREPAAAGVS